MMFTLPIPPERLARELREPLINLFSNYGRSYPVNQHRRILVPVLMFAALFAFVCRCGLQ
jgi:hypothetical protein